MKHRRRIIHSAVAALAAMFSCAPVFAETFTWSSTPTNNNWSLASNWINNTKPVSSNTADVLFANSTQFAPVQDIASPMTLRSLWFYDKPYTSSGNSLVFDGASAAIYNYTTTSISNLINLNSTITYEGTGNATFTNNIDGVGGFIKNGTGTVNLNNFTTYTGDTQINAGQIVLGNFQGLLQTSVNININNGLNLNGQNAVIGGMGGRGDLNLGSLSISVGHMNGSATYSGHFLGNGTIRKRGTGTWTLSGAGSTAVRFGVEQGRTVLSGGSLTLTSTSSADFNRALWFGTNSSGNLDVLAGANLNTFAGGSGNAQIKGWQNVASTLTVAGAGSRWDASTVDVGISATEPGALIVDNAGLVNVTYLSIGKPTGGTLLIQNNGTLNASLLTIGTGVIGFPTVSLRSGGQTSIDQTNLTTPTSSIDVDRGTFATNMLISTAGNGAINLRDPIGASALVIAGTSGSASYAGSISGVGGITKNGPSTQTLAGANTYSGPTTVNGGTLVLSSGASASYTANGPGKITLNFGNLGHSSLRVNAGGTIEYPPVVVGGFIRGSDGKHDLKQVLSFNGTTFSVDSALTQDNPLALFNVSNSGEFTNDYSLTWNGGINTSAGNFTVNSEASVSSFENNGVIAIQRHGTLINSDTKLVSGGGSRITIDGQGELDLNNKTELHLNGALLVNNGLIRGRTNVNFGAVAKGAGEYGEVNVTDGGRFSPGNSPGTVTTGSTTWNSGGSYLVEFGNTAHDLWQVNGELNLNSTAQHPFTIALASLDDLLFDASRDYTWDILHVAGGLAGLDAGWLALDVSGFKQDPTGGEFSLQLTSNDILVHFSAVPEPHAMGVLLAGILLMKRHRRRLRFQGEVC